MDPEVLVVQVDLVDLVVLGVLGVQACLGAPVDLVDQVVLAGLEDPEDQQSQVGLDSQETLEVQVVLVVLVVLEGRVDLMDQRVQVVLMQTMFPVHQYNRLILEDQANQVDPVVLEVQEAQADQEAQVV